MEELMRTIEPGFQPTLPARGATDAGRNQAAKRRISTHAPRTGSDYRGFYHLGRRRDFNPRSPHGERPGDTKRITKRRNDFNPRSPHGERHPSYYCPTRRRHFNPRSPHGERHALCCVGGDATDISTHAPRTGSDQELRNIVTRDGHFNPRSPHGERQAAHAIYLPKKDFNPRSPHGERQLPEEWYFQIYGFQPTLPARGATCSSSQSFSLSSYFNPRSPHGERH